MRSIFLGVLLNLGLLFTGCGSDDKSVHDTRQTSSQSRSVTGTFVDDPVEGLGYRCDLGVQLYTSIDGKFSCEVGQNVRFNIGNLVLPTISMQDTVITPYSLYPKDVQAALNLAQLLQSLDADGLEDNNHIVVDKFFEVKIPAFMDIYSGNFQSDLELALGKVLKNRTEVEQKLNENLEALNLNIPDNTPEPIANAGQDLNTIFGNSVSLDASLSTGDNLTYKWKIVQKPTNSTHQLSDTTLANPSFHPDFEGIYIFELRVQSDNKVSLADTVKLRVNPIAVEPLEVTLTTSGLSGEAPLSIDLNVNASGGDGDYTYVWTSGDGVNNYVTPSNALSYVYENVGTYNLELKVLDGSGNTNIINRTVSVKAKTQEEDPSTYTHSFKAYSGKHYPENDSLDGSAGSAFDPAKLIYSSYLEKHYIPYDIGGIRDWNLAIGESSFVQIFMPPGVSSVGISFNDASLASQSIELADFGEFDKNYVVPNGFDYNAHTWLYKGAQSRTYNHTRESQNLNKEGSLVLAFHDKDNLYANVNLGQFSVGYYIKAEDLDVFQAWANTQEASNIDAQYPVDGSSKVFIGGSSFPTQAHKDLIFTPRDTHGAVIGYIASAAPAKLPWQLSLGQSGYVKVFVPAGMSSVTISVNSQSLAASQSIYFKDMGEASCDALIPNAPDYEADASNWKVFTGARSEAHSINQDNISEEKCLLYSFYNKDNLNASVYLQDLGLYYTVGDENIYNTWVSSH